MLELTIGTVAKSAGVGVETIRFYERQGLIEQPVKPEAGFRHYPAEVVKRVRFIRQAKGLGFTLQEIRKLLNLSLDPEQNCSEVRMQAKTKISEINSKIDSLERMKRILSKLVVACGEQNQVQTCPIIEAIVEESI